MGEIFQSWRRKIGVVTLVVALPLMGIWIRSYVVEDRLAFTIGEFRYAIGSIQGSVEWSHWLDQPRAGGFGWSSGWLNLNEPLRPRPAYYRAPSESILGTLDFESRSVAYWPIVFPLALLSAYLLLAKSIPPKSKVVNENPAMK